MTKFKIGDQVRILDGSKNEPQDFIGMIGWGFYPRGEYIGKIGIIESCSYSSYTISGINYRWHENWLETEFFIIN
jgi:hypothetical protein